MDRPEIKSARQLPPAPESDALTAEETDFLAVLDRVALFFMDYPRKERLKLLGHARVLDARKHPELADQLTPAPQRRGSVERVFLIDVIAFDWNCPKYITPRYTETEVAAAVAPLHQRIVALEAQLKKQE